MRLRTELLDPVSEQVQTTLFRALAVLRAIVTLYAVVLNVGRWQEFDRPALGWTVLAVIVLWSGFATWAYDAPRRRGLPLLGADLAVAALTLLSTPLVQSDAMLERHASTMPSFWVIAAVLAWAVTHGWVGGIATAALVSALDLSVRAHFTGTTWGNIFLLLLAAGVVGYSTSLIREATEARAAAERLAAAMAERARLARAVHDGVLQVLALVQRRGNDLALADPDGAGGEAAELARLAGEQEVALRALVQGDAATGRAGASRGTSGTTTAGLSADGRADLAVALGRLQTSRVTVSGPATGVLLDAGVVGELVAVVRACLDNVARHVADDAPAWVLLEDLGERVVLSVRDDGPGIADGRLEQAAAEGRLGVCESVRGRVRDLGGEAVLVTAPGQGTEWEVTVPVTRD